MNRNRNLLIRLRFEGWRRVNHRGIRGGVCRAPLESREGMGIEVMVVSYGSLDMGVSTTDGRKGSKEGSQKTHFLAKGTNQPGLSTSTPATTSIPLSLVSLAVFLPNPFGLTSFLLLPPPPPPKFVLTPFSIPHFSNSLQTRDNSFLIRPDWEASFCSDFERDL